jgi:hypothetical protein
MTCVRALFLKATFVVALMPVAARSQINTAAYVLTYPISARAAAMGETGVADNSDPANIFLNPANVVGFANVYLQGSRWDIEPFLADDLWTGGGSAGISYERAVGAQPLTLSADFSYGRFDYGESVATDPTGVPLGTFHSKEEYYALTIGAGFVFSDRWNLRLGGAIKRWDGDFAPAEISTSVEPAEFEAFAYDIGATLALQTSVTEWSITPALAVAFVDAGPDVEIPESSDDPLPTRFQFGASVRVESPTTRILSAAVPVIAVVYNVDATERFHGNPFSWGIGGELALAQILFVRAGSADFDDEEGEPSDDGSGWGVGLGIPVGSFRARFDFTKTTAFYEEDKYGFAINWLL